MRPDDRLSKELEAEGVPDLEDATTADLTDTTPPPTDQPLGAEEYGTTEAEQRIDEPLADRADREEPDVSTGDAATEERNAERLVEPGAEEGLGDDQEAMVGEESGDLSGTQEEDAVRVLEENQADTP